MKVDNDIFDDFSEEEEVKLTNLKRPRDGEDTTKVKQESSFRKLLDARIEELFEDPTSTQRNEFRIQTRKFNNCTHENVCPIEQSVDFEFDVQIKNPAKEYPFTLDDFQKQAIISLENNQSVLVVTT